MRKAQIAGLLAVVLVAAVGIFVLMSGSGATGLFHNQEHGAVSLGKMSNAVCGKSCRSSADCAGNCGVCFRGRCVVEDPPVSASEIITRFNRCGESCKVVARACLVQNGFDRKKCDGVYKECVDACRVKYPVRRIPP